MRVEKITFKYARKINLGDFSSLTLDIMPTVILEDDDDLDTVLREVWQMCRTNVEYAARPIVAKSNGGVTTKELFLGLPLERTEKKEIEHAN